MGVIKGYFDDSHSLGKVWTVSGYMGRANDWEIFEYLWPLTLATHDVPYFHMKEMRIPDGVFAKWNPPEEHEAEIAAFFQQLTRAIGYSSLKGFGSTVIEADLKRFNSETGLALEAYPLAVYSCMLGIWHDSKDHIAELFFDRVEQVFSKLEKAESYAKSDTYYSNFWKKIQVIPVAEGVTFRELCPLQAADFAAWEMRKNNLGISEWFGIEGKPKDWPSRWAHLQSWLEKTTGSREPKTRKSFNALFDRAPIVGHVWDYDQLCIANKARGGVWA